MNHDVTNRIYGTYLRPVFVIQLHQRHVLTAQKQPVFSDAVKGTDASSLKVPWLSATCSSSSVNGSPCEERNPIQSGLTPSILVWVTVWVISSMTLESSISNPGTLERYRRTDGAKPYLCKPWTLHCRHCRFYGWSPVQETFSPVLHAMSPAHPSLDEPPDVLP